MYLYIFGPQTPLTPPDPSHREKFFFAFLNVLAL